VTLDDWCRYQPEISDKTEVVMQILRAMRYAHSRHIFHGDLKPQNILITPDNSVRIIDLGLAKRIEESQLQSGEQAYIRGYSKQWSSPEQIEGRWSYSQSDVFSLGRIIEAIYQSCNAEPPLLSKLQRKELAAIVGKATQHDPLHRYYSAADLLADVNRLHDGYPVTPYRNDAIYRFSKYCRRHPWRIGTYAVAIASLCVVATLIVRNNIILQKKQRSSEQIIAQMEKTLSNNLPSLSYYYKSQTVDKMYQSAAEEWLSGYQSLEPDALFATGVTLISGLFDTQQVDLAAQVLSAIKEASLSKSQQRSVDQWGFRLAGAQHLKTNYMLGGSYDQQKYLYDNPDKIEAVEHDHAKLEYYLSKLDDETLTRDEWLVAYDALGVIRPFDKQQQRNRINWILNKVAQFARTKQWQAQTIDQQLNYLQVYSMSQANNVILTTFMSGTYGDEKPDIIRDRAFELVAKQDSLSVSQRHKLSFIAQSVAKTSEESNLATDMVIGLGDVTDMEPTALLKMTQTTMDRFTTQDYPTSEKELERFMQNIVDSYKSSSAPLLMAINAQMENALQLGMTQKAKQILQMRYLPEITQDLELTQSGTLNAEFMIAVLERDRGAIAKTTQELMNFKARQAEYLLAFTDNLDDTKNYYFHSSYHMFNAMAEQDWPALESHVEQLTQKPLETNLLVAYLRILAGESSEAMPYIGDIEQMYSRQREFHDLPFPLRNDAMSEIYFLFGRKKQPKIALDGLITQAKMYHYKEQPNNVHAVKNMLFQFGLTLRVNPTMQSIEQYKQWLSHAPALEQLPERYQKYYQQLDKITQTES